MNNSVKQRVIASFNKLEVSKEAKFMFKQFIDDIADADEELQKLCSQMDKIGTEFDEAIVEGLTKKIDERINDLVGAAPEALDTLGEIAAALNNKEDFAAYVVNEFTTIQNTFEEIRGDIDSKARIDDDGVADDTTFSSAKIDDFVTTAIRTQTQEKMTFKGFKKTSADLPRNEECTKGDVWGIGDNAEKGFLVFTGGANNKWRDLGRGILDDNAYSNAPNNIFSASEFYRRFGLSIQSNIFASCGNGSVVWAYGQRVGKMYLVNICINLSSSVNSGSCIAKWNTPNENQVRFTDLMNNGFLPLAYSSTNWSNSYNVLFMVNSTGIYYYSLGAGTFPNGTISLCGVWYIKATKDLL